MTSLFLRFSILLFSRGECFALLISFIMTHNYPKIHICQCCGEPFFEEEGLEHEIYCVDCRDPWWRKDD